ncbi:unnamed protein product [Didymodactylos carnosus]|uniref:DDE Tnp4 domain-containing protein n=1 Tax=Didymodactylos carnosus TaxID=1234261 RepID=A0A8S2EBM5_9BILA|nr:unnamed protein product [Didymodactylos carnosus]CAF3993323.1 unnamed protein product [Didymodactylos carnosus]
MPHHRIPPPDRLDLFLDHDVYVHSKQKSCASHLKSAHLDVDTTIDTSQLEPAKFSSQEASQLILDLKNEVKKKRNQSLLSFDNHLMEEEDFKTFTGWGKTELETMLKVILDSNSMRGSKHRSIADALLMFWVKLKTNLTYNQIGILFNYDTSSEDRRKRVSDSCDAVMDCLLKHFVPNFLGLNRVTYQQALAHDTIYSKTFFGNGFKFTWDATYFFVNKSSDHVLQKKTYSGQKKRHYVKMMSVTLSDGYVLDTSGPYPGSKNDAQIAEHITKVNEHLAKCCGNDAVAIVDRGFDRVRTHSWEEANQSRLITKMRRAVEMYHGRLKKFLLFYQTIPNSLFEKIAPCVKIASAALNCFRPPLISSVDPKKEERLAKIMKIRADAENELKERVLEN